MKKLFGTAILLGGLVTGMADSFSTSLNYVFSGTPPNGPTPWLRLDWVDVTGGVQLTINAVGLTGNENIKDLYFNFNDSKIVGDLAFTWVSDIEATGIKAQQNKFKGGPDGKYDIVFDFTTGNGSKTLGQGDKAVYLITGSGVLASDFNFLSAPSSGLPQFIAAAHIQDTGANGQDSGWISVGSTTPNDRVPDGGTAAMLLGMAFVGLGTVGRFFKSR